MRGIDARASTGGAPGPDADRTARRTEPGSARRALAPPRVLLVEDDQVFAEFVLELLRDLAESTTTASTLEHAQRRLTESSFDCVLLDLGLPDADGLDALDELLVLDNAPPIVVLTGDDDPDQAAEAVARGAQDYVFKREVGRTSLSRSIRYALERHGLETELTRAQRLEWLATLAGKVAHDFNNLLTALFGHVELARLELDESPGQQGGRLADHLDEIDRAATRAATLTDQLLAYSRATQIEHRALSVSARLQALLPQLRSILDERTVELVSADGPDQVMLGPDRFDEMMTGLAHNSRDATSPGGRFVVRVEAPRRNDPPGRPAVRIVVADDGAGLDPSIRSRLFEPFVSTRFTGAGLGLATIRNTVEAAGGTVTATSPDTGGTVVTITLPLAAPTDIGPTPSMDPTPRVLVGIGDVRLRRFVGTILRNAGHQVTEVADPLGVVHRHVNPPDLTIVDLPAGVDTDDLVAELRPATAGRALLAIRTADEVGSPAGPDRADLTLLTAPFDEATLRAAVDRCLDPDRP